MENTPALPSGYAGMRVLVMGLGLHGGGLESVRYLARHGAELTVTDLRDERVLAPSLEQLEALIGEAPPIRYVLGRHDIEDFKRADMVIKNPGVRPDSPLLKAARRIETDISLFLACAPSRLIAVTGSKGKSSTASAIHWVLQKARNQGLLPGRAYLGGNITVSPLSFLDALTAEDDVVLELSSWQLGDLKGRLKRSDTGHTEALLKPRVAVFTAIMADHLDYYGSMDAYIADKRILYQGQDAQDLTIAGDDDWGQSFLRESRGRSLVYAERPLPADVAGGWLDGPGGPGLARVPHHFPEPLVGVPLGEPVELVPPGVLVPGAHQKKNLLAAALSLLDLGLSPDCIRGSMGAFPGIEHRLEFFHEAAGIRFYNDTSATIPEAAAAALTAFDAPVVLVTGGTDKNLDFTPLVRGAARAKARILLAGTGSERLKLLLDEAGLSYQGPFDRLDRAIRASLEAAAAGDVVVLSPGCASFGMFVNEFDRGRQWKEGVCTMFSGSSVHPG
ncbi:MAG: UDP-N-acetylmuramoyl-L-alanine--D-glutamate ligase [Treponema sp.]|jgi:UDP-N-acetylmuramoylalanine--D-glutamate ligase|nr:UDP-N-acetylmuramoyl-L-alanine--D-glutamate ligase [Treponema sp.]